MEHSQIIRLECVKAASHLYSGVGSFALDERVLASAQKFEQYIVGPEPEPTEAPSHPEVSIISDKNGNPVSTNDPFPVDLTGYTLSLAGEPHHVHQPLQHRDRKPPWCNHCGLTAQLLPPKGPM